MQVKLWDPLRTRAISIRWPISDNERKKYYFVRTKYYFELIFRTNEILIRTKELIFRTNEILTLFRSYVLVFRLYEIIEILIRNNISYERNNIFFSVPYGPPYISERLRGVFTTWRSTNPRLPLPYLWKTWTPTRRVCCVANWYLSLIIPK